MLRSILVLTWILSLFASFGSHAKTIYVDSSSNTSLRNGSDRFPFKTIQVAANKAKPGDTVLIRPGKYKSFSIINGKGAGRDGQYVTYRSVVKHAAQIVNVPGHCIKVANSSYVRIVGLRIKNCDGAGIRVVGRSQFYGPGYDDYLSRGIRISGNFISHTTTYAIGVQGLRFGLRRYERVPQDLISDVIIERNEITQTNMRGGVNECISVGRGLTNFVIRDNFIYDSKQYGIDAKAGAANGKIYGNEVVNMERHGIYLDASNHYVRNISIFGNKVYWTWDKTRGWGDGGIVVTRENVWDKDVSGEANQFDRPAFVNGIEIRNNTVVNARSFGILLYVHCYEIIKADCINGRDSEDRSVHPSSNFSEVDIYNNIVTQTREGYSINVDRRLSDYGGREIMIRDNLVYGPNDGLRENIELDADVDNVMYSNPRFADPDAYDFSLTRESPKF